MNVHFKFFAILSLTALFVAPFLVSAQSSAPDLQALIKQLQAQIQALQQQVQTLQQELGKSPEPTSPAVGSPSNVPSVSSEISPSLSEATPPELTRSLSRGSSGDDVRKLQEFLARDKDIYPEGLLTGFFGPLTEAAVKKWQEKHGVESVGIVGPKTIAKLQDIGKGVIQGLLTQGAGALGVVPPGLLGAPGIQKKLETIATTTTITIATTTQVTATTTPAIPATPAIPPPVSGSASAVPAVPATPAIPAVTSTTTATSTSSGGTVSAQLSLSLASGTTIVRGATNVPVASFSVTNSKSTLESITTLQLVCQGCSTATTRDFTAVRVEVPDASGTVTFNAVPAPTSGFYDVSFGASGFTLPAGATKTFTVKVDTSAASTSFQYQSGFYIEWRSASLYSGATISGLPLYFLRPSSFNLVWSSAANTISPVISAVSITGLTSNSAIIVWTTDTLSDSQVDYGLTSSYGNTTALNTALVTSHSVSISQLQANSTYYYRVKSNSGTSMGQFTTSSAGDASPPAISNAGATNVTSDSASIFWTTDKPADSQVEYGVTTQYAACCGGRTTTLDSNLVTSHSVQLSVLEANMIYYFRVKSKDAAGNLATATGSFTTTLVATTTTAAYTPPTSVTATLGAGKITLNWPDSGAPLYCVYRSVNGGSFSTGACGVWVGSTLRSGSTYTYNDTHVWGLVGDEAFVNGYSYKYKVFGCSGNYTCEGATGTESNSVTYGSTTSTDTTPPVISSVRADVAYSSALVSWTALVAWITDENSTSQVEYGSTSSYGTITSLDSSGAFLRTVHSISLSNLTSGTTYHYRIISKDASYNTAISGDYTFITASTTSSLDLRAKNLASIGRALESLKVILEQLLKSIH